MPVLVGDVVEADELVVVATVVTGVVDAVVDAERLGCRGQACRAVDDMLIELIWRGLHWASLPLRLRDLHRPMLGSNDKGLAASEEPTWQVQ